MSVGEGEALVAQPTSVTPKALPQTPGQALRRAREQRNLTLQQIADDLHLDMRLVQSLETDDFFSLGAPVYAKGYLRKYALLVGLAPGEIISLYERLTDVPPTPTVMPVASAYQPPQRISLRKPLLVIGTLLGIALLGWLGFLAFEYVQNMRAASAAVSAQTEQTTAAPVAAPSNVSPTSLPLAPATDAVSSDSTAERTAAAPTQQPAAREVSLRLSFTGSSWVEIYDGANKRLLYDIGQPGQTRSVSGQPPLRVTLGLSSAVTVAVNDKPVPVPRRADRDAARFTVQADGTVR